MWQSLIPPPNSRNPFTRRGAGQPPPTPTFPQLSVWGELVNRERDPKCKQTKSPHPRSGAPRSPRCPGRPSRPGPGGPPRTPTHTHSHRSCQNPDILINPGSTTLTDAAERWMQKAPTSDPRQGWRERLLQAPSVPPSAKCFPSDITEHWRLHCCPKQ